MRRNRRFVIDYSAAEDLLTQAGLSREGIQEQLISKTFFAYAAPDQLDMVLAYATLPFRRVRIALRRFWKINPPF